MGIESGGECHQDIVCRVLYMHCDTDKPTCTPTQMIAEVDAVKLMCSATWLALQGTAEPAAHCSKFSSSRSTQSPSDNS